ncbi:MAG: outer membrane protein assembly factor BamE [Nitrosospira sp.]|nr:outer membrane protein assembly factor BamE [Nitrosospira sp.]
MRAIILTLVALILLAGCSSVPSLLYKIEIQQGNVISQEMVDKLKPGMTRSQVRFALGSPMISDAFHDNRWDYVYRLEQRGRLIEQRQLTVYFEDDKLVSIDGSFKSPVAFGGAQPVEAATPIEAGIPLVKEESREETPVESGVPLSSEAPFDENGQGGSISGLSEGPAASDISDLPSAEKPSPRQAPSRAVDTGGQGADKLKE